MVELGKIVNPTGMNGQPPTPIEPTREAKKTEDQHRNVQTKNAESMRAEAVRQQRESKEKEITVEEASAWTSAANEFLSSLNLSLHFQVHEKSNRWYVQLINDDSGEVVREIPSKEMMQMAARLAEMVESMQVRSNRPVGTFVNQKG